MRQIEASEVKPGMTIQWDHTDMRVELPVKSVRHVSETVVVKSPRGRTIGPSFDELVTVLSEPQPEEPTEFGAKVVVGMQRFLRAPLHASDSTPWLSQLDARWRSWPTILAMGPVTVIPNQGWTVPADTPEVPDRIEEWPEDDAALRKHKWRDWEGAVWSSRDGQWGYHSFDLEWVGLVATRYPFDGPWVRVTDA